MGKLSSTFGGAPAPNPQAPGMMAQGGMIPKSGTMGSSGFSVQVASPSAAAAETAATTESRLMTENRVKRALDQANADAIASFGKPYADLTLDDAMVLFKGDLDQAKKFIDVKKAFVNEEGTIRKINIVVPIVDNMFKLLDKIPAAEGIPGRAISMVNVGKQKAGYLPEMTTFQNSMKMIRPLIVKGMGDSGNLSNQEQEMAMSLLQQVITGTSSERSQGIQAFKNIMERSGGKPWASMVGGKKTTYKDLDTGDLMKLLQVK